MIIQLTFFLNFTIGQNQVDYTKKWTNLIGLNQKLVEIHQKLVATFLRNPILMSDSELDGFQCLIQFISPNRLSLQRIKTCSKKLLVSPRRFYAKSYHFQRASLLSQKCAELFLTLLKTEKTSLIESNLAKHA